MDTHIKDHGKMLDEWNAWQRVVTELTKCSASIDINEEPRLTAAIELWAEILVTLRMGQGVRERNAALKDKVAGWNLSVAKS